MGQTWRDQSERRYQLERDEATEVLRLLELNLPKVIYTEGSEMTCVTTTYFDTPEGHYFDLANESGGRHTIKLRAREYFPLDGHDVDKILGFSQNCYLERKERTGTTRLKQRIELPKSSLMPIIERLADLPGQGPEVTALQHEIRSHSLAPVLISAYERRVWGSDDSLRVTFDERLRFHQPAMRVYDRTDALSPASLGRAMGVGPKRILEIKHGASDPLPPWLDALVGGLSETAAYSKFTDGMRQLRRKNRFVPSLTRPIKTGPIPGED